MRDYTIIHSVTPDLDQGKYYIKRIPGEDVAVSAVIFYNDNELVRASILYKKESDKKWKEIPMKLISADKWEGRFIVESEGFYQYKIEAWVDHLATWYHRLQLKHKTGRHLEASLATGAILLQKAAGQAEKEKAAQMRQWAKAFEDASKYQENIATAMSPEFAELMQEVQFKQFPTVFDHNLRVRVGRPRELFSTWYLLFPRSTGEKPGEFGTFKDCEKLLPRIAEMGFDVLFLPPIFPIGKTNRKGKNNAFVAEAHDVGSPWSVGSAEGGHKSVNPHLGTIEDFENLVKAAKEMGIEIALDLGLRCSADHPYVQEHPGWFCRMPDGRLAVEEIPPLNYQDIIDFNFENDDWKNLWDELKSIVLFWAEKGVRIFYGSTPHYKPIPFWSWIIQEVQSQYPELFFLSGAFTRTTIWKELAKAGFSQSFTYFLWKNSSKKELQEFVEELVKGETKEFLHPNFFTNTPDILPQNLVGAGPETFLLQYALAATLSSNCGIYGPAFELMYNQRHPQSKERYLHSEKYEIAHHNWGERNRITDFITRMNRIRKENPAFHNMFYIRFSNTDNDSLVSFIKTTPDLHNVIWCILNLDPVNSQSGYVEVPKDILGLKGRRLNLELTDLLTGEVYYWFNDWNFVELNPSRFPLHVLKVRVKH